jgi:hypothetical protein
MTEQIARVLLIDLENCPSQIYQLMENLEQYSQVVVCYAQSGAKIPIDWIMPLTSTVNDNRLKILKMPTIGKNSADFGITFWAGVLMAQLPAQTHFDIISNDTDLDYVVNLLIDQQRSAERIGIKKDNSAVMDSHIPNMATQDYYLHEYCLHLVNHSKPAKKETLLNSIKAKFKTDNIDASQLIETLVKNGVIDNSKGTKIVYNPQKINQFANNYLAT